MNYIIKKENEGKLKKVAKIAGLNKFLRMYYGIVKKTYKLLEFSKKKDLEIGLR